MKLENIAINNLCRRKSRLAFLVAGLLIGVATVVTMISLSTTLTEDVQIKMENYGANIIITPHTDDIALSYGGINLGGVSLDSQEIRQADLVKINSIRNKGNIAAIAPKVLGAIEVNGQRVMLMGVDPAIEFKLKKWWTVNGQALRTNHELVAGATVAQKLGLKIDDQVEMGGEMFTLTGILANSGSQDDQILISELATAQRLLGKQGTVSLVEVAALCADCPVSDMVTQIGEVLPGVDVSAIQQVVKTRMRALNQFRNFSLAVAAVVLLVGGLVVFVTMMGSVNERTREIGIFRALGFRRLHIMRLILFESTVVSLVAGTLGFVFGMAGTYLILPLMTENEVSLHWDPLLGGGAVVLALLVGTSASFYPALKASRLDPTEALRAL
ncbi:ABC transporter permease [Geopsychrobacter electrodiphilus]|uniref:ABC transporter permease n=1 Tax=Geopsychrobacter electrodiphilus TaxID=225196 RepID=UPI0003813D9C|nr:FtsX-like permease family protein [Geopsychrobacter electrodiphilus]